MDSSSFQGPYANTEHAPMFVQRCLCPLYCPLHGENGPIPGDMKTPAQAWEGVDVRKPGATVNPTSNHQMPVQTVALGPAPVSEDGVIGNGVVTPSSQEQPDWVAVQSPITTTEVYTTPAAIVPVEIPDAIQQLHQAGITVDHSGESINIVTPNGSVSLSFELANCLAQEILNARKRIELTLPETLETTLEAAKKRLGPDMAPLIDLILKGLDNSV